MYLKDIRRAFPPVEDSYFVSHHHIIKNGELDLHVTRNFKDNCLIGFRIRTYESHVQSRIITVTAYDKYGSPMPFMNEYDVYYIGNDRVNTWIPFSFPLHQTMINEYSLTMKVIGEGCDIELFEYPIVDICPDKYPIVFQNDMDTIQCIYLSTAEPWCTRFRHPSFYGDRQNIYFPHGVKIVPTIDRIINPNMPEWMDTTDALICSLPLYDRFNVVYIQNNQDADYSKEESCYNWST